MAVDVLLRNDNSKWKVIMTWKKNNNEAFIVQMKIQSSKIRAKRNQAICVGPPQYFNGDCWQLCFMHLDTWWHVEWHLQCENRSWVWAKLARKLNGKQHFCHWLSEFCYGNEMDRSDSFMCFNYLGHFMESVSLFAVDFCWIGLFQIVLSESGLLLFGMVDFIQSSVLWNDKSKWIDVSRWKGKLTGMQYLQTRLINTDYKYKAVHFSFGFEFTHS